MRETGRASECRKALSTNRDTAKLELVGGCQLFPFSLLPAALMETNGKGEGEAYGSREGYTSAPLFQVCAMQ